MLRVYDFTSGLATVSFALTVNYNHNLFSVNNTFRITLETRCDPHRPFQSSAANVRRVLAGLSTRSSPR
jgi:hypothetical protein